MRARRSGCCSTSPIFPGRATGAHGLVAQHPDAFVAELHAADPEAVLAAARRHRAARRRPPRSAGDDLAGCAVRVAAELRTLRERLTVIERPVAIRGVSRTGFVPRFCELAAIEDLAAARATAECIHRTRC